MVLSTKLQKLIQNAIPDRKASAELIADLQAELGSPAADVAANSPASAITVPDNTQGSINTALASVVADVNADRTQINAILTALKGAGLML